MKKHIPNTLTLCNLLSGCAGVVFATRGNFSAVLVCLIFSELFDFFDGFSARALGAYSDIGKELSGEGLGKLIRAAIAGENVADYAAEVSEVGDALKKELAQEIKNGLEIRPTKEVQQGFRLAAKDGSGYFDCSDDGIMEMLMPYFRDLDFQ